MAKILIVDDSPLDQQLAGRLLQKGAGADWLGPDGPVLAYANNGLDALAQIGQQRPDLVLTDLHMPELTGLQLVEEIKLRYPLVPVVLMTAHGSEEVALQALRRGAASYVPKKNLAKDLLDTIAAVLEAAHTNRNHTRLLECLTGIESRFELDNDSALIPPLIGYLKDNRFRISGSDETGLVRVTMALREAILNAMHHGNLELSSDLREVDCKQYHMLCEERRIQAPYKDRRVTVIARDTPTESVYVIRDEGPGFDPSKLPDPLDPANMDKVSGRGLLLIRTFMDAVTHNAKGNEITMIKFAQDDEA